MVFLLEDTPKTLRNEELKLSTYNQTSLHVVIGGPPHSGKSTFTAALIEHVRERHREQPFTISFEYVTLDITDNSLEWLLDDTGSVNRKRDVEWTNENAKDKADEFAEKPCQLVIADAPGKLTEQLDIVMEPADRMVILVSDEKSEKLTEWRDRANELDISVDYEITSFIDDDADIQLEDRAGDTMTGTIKSASRDDFNAKGTHAYDDKSRRVIRYIATQLVQKATKE